MKARLKNHRQSPRKVRLLARFVRGKEVSKALTELSFVSKRAADPVAKVIKSAVANAKTNHGFAETDLYIKEITVNKGFTLHRFMPRAFGRATPINKRTSNVTVVLAPREQQNIQDTSNKKQASAPSTTEGAGQAKPQTEKETVKANEAKS